MELINVAIFGRFCCTRCELDIAEDEEIGIEVDVLEDDGPSFPRTIIYVAVHPACLKN